MSLPKQARKMVKKGLRLVKGLMIQGSLLFYGLSFLFPRNKKIWVFGGMGGKVFDGNSKHFFLHVAENHADVVQSIWLTRSRKLVEQIRNMGFNAHHIQSLAGIYYALRGGVYVYTHAPTDISFYLSGGARKINLWHGIPLKKINYDNEADEVRNPKSGLYSLMTLTQRLRKERPSHYLLSTSDYVSGIFTRAFRIPLNHMLVAGYPRNDVLFNKMFRSQHSSEYSFFIEKLERSSAFENNKTFIYMPTFRKAEFEDEFFSYVDLEKLDAALVDVKVRVLFKLHPKSKIKQHIESLSFTNILVVPANLDIYPLIPRADGLITDYSSIFFDYLLLDRPIIFFPYDLESYMQNSRDLYFDYETFVPGPIVRTQSELIAQLSEMVSRDKDSYIEQRAQMKKKFFAHPDGQSSRRLFRLITNNVLHLKNYQEIER